MDPHCQFCKNKTEIIYKKVMYELCLNCYSEVKDMNDDDLREHAHEIEYINEHAPYDNWIE